MRGRESVPAGGEAPTAEAFLPDRRSLRSLRRAAGECRGCHLHERATQTVFGEGRVGSRLVLVGEMPGDAEDEAGRPFVGPAGRVLSDALEEAGIDRRDAYVTNVVKHFKWRPRGKRRLHERPNADEVRSCRPWLEAELERIAPRVLVALGATAAKALLGSSFRISREHGRFVESDLAAYVTATTHPAAVLRRPTPEGRREERQRLVADLRGVARVLEDRGA